MKKIIVRIVGSLCFLASLALFFMMPMVQIEDVSKKDMRNVREEVLADLQVVRDTLLTQLEYNSDLKEDLKDNDLPSTKSKVKQRLSETEDLLKEILDLEVSMQEVLTVSMKAPGYIADLDNLLETSECMDLIEDNSTIILEDDLQDVMDIAGEMKAVFYCVTGLILFVLILGLVAVVTRLIPKVQFLQYFYLPILVLLVAGICVGIWFTNNAILGELQLSSEFEDMSLRVTIMPFLAVALSIVPIVLNIIFKEKKRGE